MSDLFPKTKQEPIDYGTLEESLRNVCTAKNHKDVDGQLLLESQKKSFYLSVYNEYNNRIMVVAGYINKCIQLYETTVVRHGLMLVGPSGSGKTKVSHLHLSKVFVVPYSGH